MMSQPSVRPDAAWTKSLAFACLSATALALAACGGDPDGDPSKSSASTSTSEASSAHSPTSSASSSSAPEAARVVWAINAGGAMFEASDGTEYSWDDYYTLAADSEGGTGSTDTPISNTDDQALYQSERWGSHFRYDLPVTEASYNVTLHMVEFYEPAQVNGGRVQDIRIEGELLLDDWDTFAMGGAHAATPQTFEGITVTDGALSIELIGVEEAANIAGILVTSVDGERGTVDEDEQHPIGEPVFSDDFEAYGSSNQPQGVWDRGANVNLVTGSEAYQGGTSVRINGASFLTLSDAATLDDVANTQYGRMRVFLDGIPADEHWTIVEAVGPGRTHSGDTKLRLGGQHGNGRLMSNFETTGTSTDCWDHSAVTMPQGQWACVEWHFETETNKMRFWLNDSELRDIASDGMGEGCIGSGLDEQWIFPTEMNQLKLGWANYHGGAPQTMLIDDVALGTERVGCGDE